MSLLCIVGLHHWQYKGILDYWWDTGLPGDLLRKCPRCKTLQKRSAIGWKTIL